MSWGSKLVAPTVGALALGALVTAAWPAAAQVVVGGSNPSVVVNLGVLDHLGPEPTLPGMLIPGSRPPAAQVQGTQQPPPASAFKPYAQVKKERAARPVATAAVPAKSVTRTKPAHKAEEPKAVAELVEAARTARAETPIAAPEMKAEPKAALPPRAELALDVPTPPKPEKATKQAKKASEGALPSTLEPITPPPAETAKVLPAPAPAPVVAPAAPPASSKPMPLTKAEPPVAPPAPTVAPTPTPAPVVVAPPVAPPVAPVAAPVVAPPVAVQPTQLASLPPTGGVLRKGDTLSVLFSSEASGLPAAAKSELDGIAKRMEKDEGLSLQLLAYADGDEANASKARRLSLSRALEVRKYLMELGVRSTRIEVRALGNKSDGGPADRVDALLSAR